MSIRNDIDKVMRSDVAVIPYGIATLLIIGGLAALAWFFPFWALMLLLAALIVGAILGARYIMRMVSEQGGR